MDMLKGFDAIGKNEECNESDNLIKGDDDLIGTQESRMLVQFNFVHTAISQLYPELGKVIDNQEKIMNDMTEVYKQLDDSNKRTYDNIIKFCEKTDNNISAVPVNVSRLVNENVNECASKLDKQIIVLTKVEESLRVNSDNQKELINWMHRCNVIVYKSYKKTRVFLFFQFCLFAVSFAWLAWMRYENWHYEALIALAVISVIYIIFVYCDDISFPEYANKEK